MKRVAVIDLGSNSLKLLVAEGENANPVHESFAELRLLARGNANAEIEPQKMAEAVDVIHGFLYRARLHRADEIAVVGTSVFRTAKNANVLRERIRSALGVTVLVLTPEQEAKLAAKGVMSDPKIARLKPVPAIFDLGGGSLEFIAPNGEFSRSWKLGCAAMNAEIFPNGFYQSAFPLAHAERLVRERLERALLPVFAQHVPAGTPLAICAGTLTVASFVHSFPKLRPLDLREPINVEDICALYRTLVAHDTKTCMAHGVPPARVETLPTGLIILATLADIAAAPVIHASSRNLRFGIAAKLLESAGD